MAPSRIMIPDGVAVTDPHDALVSDAHFLVVQQVTALACPRMAESTVMS
jgi:hypothetical protein